MAILIKGMKMPKNCHECRFCIQEADTDLGVCADCCVTWKHWEAYSTRPDWCPLVVVPDERIETSSIALGSKGVKLFYKCGKCGYPADRYDKFCCNCGRKFINAGFDR